MAEDNKEEFTFNDLSSLLRVEKASGLLSDVRTDLYPSIQKLMESLDRECERISHVSPDSVLHDGAIEKRRKAVHNVKRLIELRMNKVATLALRGSIGAQNNTDNLPPEEKDYYERILVASKIHWGLTDHKKKNVVIPDISSISEEKVEPEVPKPIIQEEVKIETLADVPYIPDDEPMDVEEIIPDFDEDSLIEEELITPSQVTEEVHPAEVVEEVIEDISPVGEEVTEPIVEETYIEEDYEGFTTIIISESLPIFSGPEREYNLKKGDLVKMPTMMANALINRSMAIRVNV